MTTECKRVPLAAVMLMAMVVVGVPYICLLASAAACLCFGLHRKFFLVLSFREPRGKSDPRTTDAAPVSPRPRVRAATVKVPLFFLAIKIVR